MVSDKHMVSDTARADPEVEADREGLTM